MPISKEYVKKFIIKKSDTVDTLREKLLEIAEVRDLAYEISNKLVREIPEVERYIPKIVKHIGLYPSDGDEDIDTIIDYFYDHYDTDFDYDAEYPTDFIYELVDGDADSILNELVKFADRNCLVRLIKRYRGFEYNHGKIVYLLR